MERLVNKVRIYANNNIRSNNIRKDLEKKLKKSGFVLVVDDSFDLCIAVGGDGAFLRMMKEISFKEDAYYIGINTGTLGFAQEVSADKLDDFIYKLSNNLYKVEEVGIEEIVVHHGRGKQNLYAINEITIRDSELNVTKLNIRIDDHYLETFVGDGLLVSTSFGSTAYNLSFGGSIIYNTLHTLQITPIAPFNPKSFKNLLNPIVIPQNSIISIVPEVEKRNLIVTVDGENIFYEDVTLIETFVKDRRVNCLREKDYNFIDKVNDKFVK